MGFFALEYRKTHFSGLYGLKKDGKKDGKKKKDGKMTNFWAKPWVNPFAKMLIFRLFALFFYYCLVMRFFRSRIS